MAATARQGGGDGCGGCLAWFFAIMAIGLVIEGIVWLVGATGHVLGLTPTLPEHERHDKAWLAAHYAHLGWGYVLAVLVLVAGIPLSVALTVELGRTYVEWRRAAVMGALLVALAATISFAPVGRVAP